MPTPEYQHPRQCPKWARCNAPVCPLDSGWRKITLNREDSTCFYLSESVKHDAEAIFRERGLGDLFEVMSRLTPTIRARHRRIDAALMRASKSGSRMTKLN